MNILNHQNDEEYQSIFENALEGIFQSSLDGRFLKVNPEMARIYGYDSPEDMLASIKDIGKQIYVNAKDRESFLKELQNKGLIDKFEDQNFRKDRSIIWTQTTARIVQDSEGNALFIEGFITDITSRKEAERALKQSEEQFKKIFLANPIASCIATLAEGRFIAANDAYWKLSGFKPDEFIGHTSIELGFIKASSRKKLVARLKKERTLRNEGGKLITKSGEFRDTLEFFDLINFDGQDCILSMFYDITEQTKAQQALQENEEKYRQLFEAESDAIFLIDNESGNILDVNAAATTLYGYSKEDLLKKTNSDLSAEPERTRKVTQNTPIDKNQVISIPIRFHKKKNGTIFPVEITGRFFEWRGRPVHIAAIRDITERKKVEEALKTSEERFRLSFQTSPDSININRLKDGLYIDINEGFTNITGYTREEVIGKTSLEIDIWENPADREKLIDGIGKNGFVNNQEAKFRTKDGRVLTGLMSARIITLDGALHIISITREIEAIKQNEAMLQKQLRELTILHNIAVVASSSTNVNELLQRTTDTIWNTLHPDNCGAELVAEAGDAYLAHPSYRGASTNKIRKPLPLSKGIVGKVISTGKAIRLGDVTQEPAYIEVTQGILAELCVPIKIQDRVIGAFNVESKQADAYTESDERLLNTIAGTLATAIEQLRLFETSQRHLQELTTINAVSLASTRAKDLDELIESVTQIIGESLYPDNFGVLLLNNEGIALMPHPSYRGITHEKSPKILLLDQGISGQVATSGKPVRIANVRTHKKYIEVTSQVRSELCVPINLANRVLGVINAESVKINAFTQDDEQLLTTIASTLATAIEKLRLLEEEKKRRQEAEVLLDATNTLTTSLNLDTLLDLILETLSKIITYDSASIALQQNEKLVIVAGRGFHPELDVIGRSLVYSEKWFRMSTSHHASILPDVHLDPSFERWEGFEYIRGWMGVPLIVHDKLIGYINLDSREPNAFTEKNAVLAQTFANSAAVAIENARLFAAEHRRRREAETLRQAALAITTSLELESVLETILIVMKQVVPYDSASVMLLDESELCLMAVQGFPNAEEILNLRFPADNELFIAVKENEEPVILKNAQQDKRFKNWANTEYVHGWMGVPLILRNEVIGYITFDSRQEDVYNQALATLAQAFANQAALAIQNARQFKAEQRHFQEAETLRQAAEAITSTLDIQQVLNSILDNLNRVIPFDSASVFLIENDSVRLTAIKGMPDGDNSIGLLFPANNALFQEISRTGQPFILKDTQIDSRSEKWVADQVHGWMGVPLIARGIIIGYITIDSHKIGAYNEHDANLATTFAHQAAVAIENARLYKRGEGQIRQLTVLRDIDSAISSSFDLRVTLNLLIGYAVRELNANAIAILLYNSDLKSLSLYTSIGFSNKPSSQTSYIRIGEGLAGRVVLQRKLVQVANLNDSAESFQSVYTDNENFKSYFGVPLLGKGQIKGVMELYTREEFYPDTDWLNFLHTLAGQAAIAIDNVQLFKNLQRSNQELILAYDTTLAGWGRALELRDKETQGHTDRVVELTVELARRMGIEGEELTNIMRGTLLHDIGKMGIPDQILHKPGPLTEEEWAIMRQHPQYAYDLMKPIPYLRPALEIPYSHHERWDGSGYPRGLKGEDIPLAARIFAVVDIWDALRYKRIYRAAWPEEKVLEYLKNTAGIELDPVIVEKFFELLEEDDYKMQAE